MMKKVLAFVALSAVVSSCSVSQVPLPGITRVDAPGLSREHAEYRARTVADVAYELAFYLDAEQPEFNGKSVITFAARTAGAPLTIDFTGGEIRSLAVNGETRPVESYNGRFLAIPEGILKQGLNRVEVAFTHPYSTTSSGLYRFKDPQDGRIYLYTDLEPYQANQVYPCFDQPDLKAKYTLSVETPAAWKVISATREESVAASGGRKTWRFPASLPMSPYVFALHAGEYREWAATAGDVPLRLYARQSLAPKVDVEEWFDLTRKGLAYYNDYFGTPYPFKKYDQVLVPDFNWGGMENVAAVTFNDKRYVFDGKPTLTERERRASTILHEMAHMWFGDLVTMRWWDDLWLNESFATYTATEALVAATEYKGAWLSFFARSKAGAYYEDGLATTHPIASRVPDTEQTAANFDGITYGKGASTLKQLSYFITPEKFREGLRAYFKEHAFGNATLADFFAAMQQASSRDLKSWSQEWIATQGFDTLRPEWECRDGKIAAFTLKAQKSSAESARVHRTRVALYRFAADGRIVADEAAEIAYGAGVTPVAEFVGKICPAFAFANEGDEDYVKTPLDPRTAKIAAESLARVVNPLTRAGLWHGLWQRVLDGESAWQDYADAVLTHLPKETDFRIAQMVANTIAHEKAFLPTLNRYIALGDESTRDLRTSYRDRMESFLWHAFARPGTDSDRRTLFFDTFVRVAASLAARENLAKLLDGEAVPEGFVLDQTRRWTVVVKLCELGDDRAEERLSRETERDPSNNGKMMALAAKAALADHAGKMRWLDEMAAADSKRNAAEFKAVMSGLFPLTRPEERVNAADRYYAVLEKISVTRDPLFLESFVESMAPTACSSETADKLRDFISAHPDVPPIVMKNLRNAEEEESRCLEIQTKASQAVVMADEEP